MPTLKWLRRDRDRQRRDLAARRKRFHAIRRRIHKLKAGIAKRNRQIKAAQGTDEEKAVKWLLSQVGKVETGYNDAPWLRAWEDSLPHDRLDWMIPGQPYCGFADIVAYWRGARKLLPDDTVSTIAITNRAVRGDGYRLVPLSEARLGDMPVFHFGSGGPKHVGMLLGPIKGGIARCVEANTSPGNSGSQANGGGVYIRNRPVGFIHCVARPI